MFDVTHPVMLELQTVKSNLLLTSDGSSELR